jgi:hypothetical protein
LNRAVNCDERVVGRRKKELFWAKRVIKQG